MVQVFYVMAMAGLHSMTGEEARGNWSLEISPVRSSDDGVYQCQVRSEKDELVELSTVRAMAVAQLAAARDVGLTSFQM